MVFTEMLLDIRYKNESILVLPTIWYNLFFDELTRQSSSVWTKYSNRRRPLIWHFNFLEQFFILTFVTLSATSNLRCIIAAVKTSRWKMFGRTFSRPFNTSQSQFYLHSFHLIIFWLCKHMQLYMQKE